MSIAIVRKTCSKINGKHSIFYICKQLVNKQIKVTHHYIATPLKLYKLIPLKYHYMINFHKKYII